MNRIQTFCLVSLTLLASAWAASPTDPAPGWASLNGGTKGGAGGTEVTVKTMADLQKYAKMEGKYIIWVEGSFGNAGTSGEGNGDRVVLASDKSILGKPGATLSCGFDIKKGVSNIILRNLKIVGPGALDKDGLDAITVQDGVKNVWFDHLDMSDGEDGTLDITHACDYITISYTKFTYTSKSFASGTSGKSHRFCNLIGHDDDNAEEDTGHLLVTFYKVWWGEGVAERMPRVRFGKVHVANCLFTSKDPGQGHCIRPAIKADVLVESNAFIGQKKPLDVDFDPSFTAITSKNNLFKDCTGNTTGKGTAFTPTYAALPMTDPAMLQEELSNPQTGAGATLTWGTTTTLAAPSHKNLLQAERDADLLIVDVTGRKLIRRARQAGEPASLPLFGKAAEGRAVFLQSSAR